MQDLTNLELIEQRLYQAVVVFRSRPDCDDWDAPLPQANMHEQQVFNFYSDELDDSADSDNHPITQNIFPLCQCSRECICDLCHCTYACHCEEPDGSCVCYETCQCNLSCYCADSCVCPLYYIND